MQSKILVSELPARLLQDYRVQMEADEPPGGSYYRPGDLDTVLMVFQTSHGPVFVDGGGGGMALAESSQALNEFAERNGWRHALGCLDGTLNEA
jgi:hypothetical protein